MFHVKHELINHKIKFYKMIITIKNIYYIMSFTYVSRGTQKFYSIKTVANRLFPGVNKAITRLYLLIKNRNYIVKVNVMCDNVYFMFHVEHEISNIKIYNLYIFFL